MNRSQRAFLDPKALRVRLCDGRLQEIFWHKPFVIEGIDVHSSRSFDFRPIDLGTPLGNALAEIFMTRCGRNTLQTLQALNKIIVSLVSSVDQSAPIEKGAILEMDAVHAMGLKPLFYSFLRDVAEHDPECFTAECLSLVYSLRSKNRRAYKDLRKNDPRRGAYSEQELFEIRSAVNQAYEEGRIDLREFAFVWTLIATGLRPIQICKLRICDVKLIDGPDGREVNLLVPLAKGPRSGPKSTRWIRRCPPVLATILVSYIEELASRSRRPLDPNARVFGYTSYDVSNIFMASTKYKGKINREIVVRSERTGGITRISPKRFRYTLATRAVAFGASDHEVARLMTHTTISSIKHYRAALPAIMKPVRKALRGHMNLIARAFQGQLVSGSFEATRSSEEEALIRDFLNLGGRQIGACGTSAVCYQNAPISCLTCNKFEAFRDAPWRELLLALQQDLESEKEDRIKLITLEAINAVNQILERVNESK